MSHGFWAWALPGLVCTALLPGPAPGQCQRAKLVAPDGAPFDMFGFSVALSGNTAAIGDPSDDGYGKNSGAVYMFEGSGPQWILQLKLTLPDAKAEQGFGYTVALDGSTLLALAWDPYPTVVHVFDRSGAETWEHTAILSAGVGYTGFFGWSLSLSEDTAVVGAPQDSEKAAGAGAAFIFERGPDATWSAPVKLLATDGQVGDAFGDAVAVSGDISVIGAQDDDDLGNWSGSAYVFERLNGAWVQTAKLLPKDGTVFWNFGTSVAVADDVVLNSPS